MTPGRPLRGCTLLVLSVALASAAAAERVQGLVDPGREVTLAAPLAGIVAELPFEEGDRVNTGDAVALMDDRLQQVEVEKAKLRAEAEAPIQEAQAVLAEQEIVVERAEEAQAGSAASNWEVRRARLQRDQAKAALLDANDQQRLAATELKLQRELLERHRVQSPFDGRVTRRLIQPGHQPPVRRRDPVAGQPQPASRSDPPAHRAVRPAEGRRGVRPRARLCHLHRAHRGRLIALDPVIDSASRTFRCLFEIANDDESLPAGFVVFLETDSIPAAEATPTLLDGPAAAAP